MTIDPVPQLRSDLLRAHRMLARNSLLAFSAEQQSSLRDAAQKLLEKLERVAHGQLTVGLLGGTGVGKSTIMNALAGEEIASTSHRRPHTNQVLLYRHDAALLPGELERSQIPWLQVCHQAEPIRHVLLCDLPDFDSLAEQNRESVLGFLEHLDVLVWVSSPEKYADARFYEFLKLVPKANQNFYFVLNKADLLFQGKEPESAYASLTSLLEQFHQHIIRQDVRHPLLYAVAAREALQDRAPAPWNQFAALRQQIFQQRDLKEIVAIKAANIDEEAQRLLDSMQKELFTLEFLQEALTQIIQSLDRHGPEWSLSGRNALALWVEKDVKPQWELRSMAPSLLVGPGRRLALLHQQWQQLVNPPRHGSTPGEGCSRAGSEVLPAELAGQLQRHFQHLENHLVNQLRQRSAAPQLLQKIQQDLDLQGAWEHFAARLESTLESRLADQLSARPVPGASAFRLSQYLAYLCCFGLFVWALPGPGLWNEFLQKPGLSSGMALLLTMAYSLFTPRGLAALGTLLLLQGLLAANFHRRYKKLLQRRSQKIIDSLKDELGALWDDSFHRSIEALKQIHATMQEQVAAISDLRPMSLRE
jgi:GTP-binding protein EngB required for normal cell division